MKNIDRDSKPRFVFGPVPSRRLGISLGLDVIPFKTCSLDCLYCECGPTTRLTIERQSFFPKKQLLAELRSTLPHIPHLDFITFSGSGEPTLNADLGWFIGEIKKLSRVPLAVLTNGTMMHLETVRRDVQMADVILPSLDAATPAAFVGINQPHAGLDLERIIAGLAALREEFKGKIWLEVFIVKGINDREKEIAALGAAIRRIRPDKVQLNTLDRPPAYPGVVSADFVALEKIRAGWPDLKVEIIKRTSHRGEILSFSRNLENSLLNTIRRRPLTLDDLQALTAKGEAELRQYLDVLEREKKIRPVIQDKKIFFTAV
ncbi:MAG: radical SAM protein [Candidatus Aminicenantes bacterium]|nr:radical SAM protein [Candidatus Aminicenantes bacterium]